MSPTAAAILSRLFAAILSGNDHGVGDLSLEIEPMRDLRSGEQRSEVQVRFRSRFGTRPLAASSGGQRVFLGYALRIALGVVQAEAHGLKVTHVILDEGWSELDSTRVLEGQQMLRRIAERCGRVWYVSHVGEIRECADTRIRVYANGSEGSLVEVAA